MNGVIELRVRLLSEPRKSQKTFDFRDYSKTLFFNKREENGLAEVLVNAYNARQIENKPRQKVVVAYVSNRDDSVMAEVTGYEILMHDNPSYLFVSLLCYEKTEKDLQDLKTKLVFKGWIFIREAEREK
jgi:hypothetical protein